MRQSAWDFRNSWVVIGPLVALALLLAVFLSSSGVAEAQTGNATLEVTVRYPNGQLVNDTDVCIDHWDVGNDEFQGLGGDIGIPSGPQTTISGLDVDGQYAVRATTCQGDNSDPFVSTLHDGTPWELRPESRIAEIMDVIEPTVGVNAVDIVVRRAHISGTITGPSASRCRVVYWAEDLVGTTAFGPILDWPGDDGSYETLLPVGTYTVETQCFISSAYEAWNNVEAVDDATRITVGHNQTRSGINFDITDRFDESAGSLLLFTSVDAGEPFLPHCLESYDLAGKLINRAVVEPQRSDAVGAPTNGSYRVRFTDCFDVGVQEVWYPDAPTAAGAEIIEVDGSLIEISFDAPVSLVDPELTECNGLAVTIVGTNHADTLVGTAGPDIISGLGGNDLIEGLGGDDVICGGAGRDIIRGNAGADWADGGPGNDIVRGGWGEDELYGGSGNDFINSFKHDDFVDGGTGHDRIRGGWGNDVLRGGEGNDVIRAWNGADRLFGDSGNDVLIGEIGPDYLVGGPGLADRLFGSQGRDTCRDVGAETLFVDCEL